MGPQVLWKHRGGTLIQAQEGFVQEKLDLEGWVGFYRQERGMRLSWERKWNEQKGRKGNSQGSPQDVDQCVYEVFNFSSVYKELWLV